MGRVRPLGAVAVVATDARRGRGRQVRLIVATLAPGRLRGRRRAGREPAAAQRDRLAPAGGRDPVRAQHAVEALLRALPRPGAVAMWLDDWMSDVWIALVGVAIPLLFPERPPLPSRAWRRRGVVRRPRSFALGVLARAFGDHVLDTSAPGTPCQPVRAARRRRRRARSAHRPGHGRLRAGGARRHGRARGPPAALARRRAPAAQVVRLRRVADARRAARSRRRAWPLPARSATRSAAIGWGTS